MTRTALFTLLMLAAALPAFSQNAKPVKKEESDPEAKALLDKVRKKYEGHKTLDMDFTLELEVPGQKTDSQKGNFKSKGDQKYRLDLPDQTITSDGSATWVFLKKQNEVQVNDASEQGDGAFISPNELIKIYQKGDYLFALAGEETTGGKACQLVEFKPVKKTSEYSKLRLAIDKKTSQLVSIKAFAKDGGRYTFAVSKQSADKAMDDAQFTWDQSKHPGVRVEDLRM